MSRTPDTVSKLTESTYKVSEQVLTMDGFNNWKPKLGNV